MRQWALWAMLILSILRTATAQVLMEVPLLLELPGREQLIRAWYDGEEFLVEGSELFPALGFTVQHTEAGLEALDKLHRHAFVCAPPPGPSCKILMNDVLDRLGSALHFDQNRLHLTASSVATAFDVRSLRTRQRSWAEVPGPHLFGRTRSVWGGMMVNWQLRRDAFGVHPSLRFTGSVLHGSVEADLNRGHSWVYRYDWPERTWLTQIEMGRDANGFARISITNMPLARRRLHRVQHLRGQSAPHALVQAVISGEVVDQVQADAEGHYELHAPAWYGTTKLEVRTQPLGGQRMHSDHHYLFTPTTLAPPGNVFYQLRASEEYSALDLQYGVHQRLTLQSALALHDRHPEASVGFTLSPITFLAANTKVQIPSAHWLTTLQLWRSGIQVTVHLDGWKRQLQNLHVNASTSKGPVSVLLRGTRSSFLASFTEWGQRLSLHPEVWLHAHSGLLMQAGWDVDWLRHVEKETHHRWRFATGWAFPQLRIMGFATQDYIQKVYGVEGILTLGGPSLEFRVGWDADHQTVIGSLSLQISSPFGSLFARGHRDTHGMSHSQQIQGSVHLWDTVRLAPYGHQQSATELRIFQDINGNGLQDPAEPILSHIDAELYQGGWTRLRTGALYAAYLEPYQRYQVRILEASIRDPALHPATGLEFSFTADPGRSKIIHVPMQRLIPVVGKITGLDRTPLRLKILLNQSEVTDVYRDGGFALHLRPGHYTLTVVDILDQEPLAEKRIEVGIDPLHVVIDLEKIP